MANGSTQNQGQVLMSSVCRGSHESLNFPDCSVDPATDRVIGSCPEMFVNAVQ